MNRTSIPIYSSKNRAKIADFNPISLNNGDSVQISYTDLLTGQQNVLTYSATQRVVFDHTMAERLLNGSKNVRGMVLYVESPFEPASGEEGN